MANAETASSSAAAHDSKTGAPSPTGRPPQPMSLEFEFECDKDISHPVPSSSTWHRDVQASFDSNGFVVLRRYLSAPQQRNALQQWQSFCQDYFQRCFHIMHDNHHIDSPCHRHADPPRDYTMQCGMIHGFQEIVMRSPGRYELSLLHAAASSPALQHPDTSCIVTSHFTALLELLLGTKSLKLCHLSLLVATPDCADQSWHCDGGHVDITQHLPCHVLNVFIPLQDVPTAMGPTEFRPGGHYLSRKLKTMMLAAACRKTLRPPVCPEMDLGDVVIFDYRVLHRGRANHHVSKDRNYLVLTYSQPWFEDILNFPKNKSMYDPAEVDDGEQRSSNHTD